MEPEQVSSEQVSSEQVSSEVAASPNAAPTAGAESAPAAADPRVEAAPSTDWEKRYKDLQSKSTKDSQELAQMREVVAALTAQIGTPQQQGADLNISDDDYVQGSQLKQFAKQMKASEGRVGDMLLTLKFQQENPDLAGYDHLVGAILAHQTDQRLPKDQRLSQAANKAREFLANERRKGEVAARAEIEKKQKEAAAAAGMSSGTTHIASTPSDDDRPQSTEDYIRQRQAQTAKLQGSVLRKCLTPARASCSGGRPTERVHSWDNYG